MSARPDLGGEADFIAGEIAGDGFKFVDAEIAGRGGRACDARIARPGVCHGGILGSDCGRASLDADPVNGREQAPRGGVGSVARNLTGAVGDQFDKEGQTRY